jgi:hypothetical protein
MVAILPSRFTVPLPDSRSDTNQQFIETDSGLQLADSLRFLRNSLQSDLVIVSPPAEKRAHSPANPGKFPEVPIPGIEWQSTCTQVLKLRSS